MAAQGGLGADYRRAAEAAGAQRARRPYRDRPGRHRPNARAEPGRGQFGMRDLDLAQLAPRGRRRGREDHAEERAAELPRLRRPLQEGRHRLPGPARRGTPPEGRRQAPPGHQSRLPTCTIDLAIRRCTHGAAPYRLQSCMQQPCVDLAWNIAELRCHAPADPPTRRPADPAVPEGPPLEARGRRPPRAF